MTGKDAAGYMERELEWNPSLPRWVCQKCRHALIDVGVGSSADKFFSDSSRSGMQTSVQGSVMGSSRMDESFVVLPKQRNRGHGVPPRSRSSTLQLDAMQPGKAMEESFVVLPPSAAFRYESDFIGEGGEPQSAAAQDWSSSRSSQIHNSDFHSKITVLKRAFEIATSETQVERPLCLECMRVLLDKFDEEVEDVNRDIKAYEACLLRSELESCDVSNDKFVREEQKFKEEEKRLQAEIEATEKRYAEVKAETEELQRSSEQFKELEERYWHEFNEFQFQLITQQEERDAIIASIEVFKAHLELVKRIDVRKDAFTIWHDGEFGTINNFRLGRLPNIPVEWDEINAAWGQACLLLHTMAQHFSPKFSYRIKILAMGSYPHIMDTSSNSYELFGPVNMFWSTHYDKAMTLFLTCLKEFAEFANSKDQENNIPLDKCFKLPYKIKNDKVENYTITQSFNSQENWTKALKYTLCNLKWVWHWFVGNSTFQPLPAASR